MASITRTTISWLDRMKFIFNSAHFYLLLTYFQNMDKNEDKNINVYEMRVYKKPNKI